MSPATDFRSPVASLSRGPGTSMPLGPARGASFTLTPQQPFTVDSTKLEYDHRMIYDALSSARGFGVSNLLASTLGPFIEVHYIGGSVYLGGASGPFLEAQIARGRWQHSLQHTTSQPDLSMDLATGKRHGAILARQS